MVLGSASVLAKDVRRKMKLDVHQQREKELKLGDSKAFKMRRDRVQKRHDVKRNRRVKHLAKKLGFEERHLKALQEEFNSMDEDHSGEIDQRRHPSHVGLRHQQRQPALGVQLRHGPNQEQPRHSVPRHHHTGEISGA